MKTLKKIGTTAHNINVKNGWETFQPSDFPLIDTHPQLAKERVHHLGTHMALIHEEVAEAFRGVRNRDSANFQEEMADVVIRVTSIMHGLGFDLDKAVRLKLKKNRTRGWRHGEKAV